MCKCFNQFDINTNPIITGIRNIELHVISSDSETDTTNHEINYIREMLIIDLMNY